MKLGLVSGSKEENVAYGERTVTVCGICKAFRRISAPCGICGAALIVDDIISIEDYYKGREVEFAGELTQEMKNNAVRLLSIVNNIIREISGRLPNFQWDVTSGWRPPSINMKLGGKPKSNHIMCRAIDISDPQGRLDAFFVANEGVLRKHGCAIEHPDDTPNWCHIQDRKSVV